MRFSILLLAGCARNCAQPQDSAEVVDSGTPEDVRVIVMVLDGVRVEESFGEGASDVLGVDTDTLFPRMRSRLFPAGTRMTAGIAAGMTRTAPGHCDLLTGRRTAFANYPNDTPDPGAYLPELPTLIDAIAPDSALVVTSSPLVSPVYRSVSAQGGEAATLIHADSDTDGLLALRDLLPDSDHRLVVVNLHRADALGHNGPLDGYGSETETYDDAVMNFWLWLQEQPDWGHQTVMAVIADHGRHRFGDGYDEEWRDHGDHCAGCREIPMFLIGPGIQHGVDVDTPVTLEDLGATLAHLLGVDLPYAIGAPIAGALKEPAAAAPGGAIDVAGADGVQAVVWLADGRASIRLEDTVVSSAEAFSAEAPVVSTWSDVSYACWRELDLTETLEPGTWPWRPRCVRQEGGAQLDIDPPVWPVWSMWQPSMVADDDGLWMAWVDNLTGIAMLNSSVQLSRWEAASGWEDVVSIPTGSFPDGLQLHHDGTRALLAMADATTGAEARLERGISLLAVEGASLEALLRLQPEGMEVEGAVDVVVEGGRLEHPALLVSGGSLSLAWVAYSADPEAVSASLWRIDSADDGESWGAPVLVDGAVLGHLTPGWTDGGALVWVKPDGQLCRDGDCTALEAPEVGTLAVDGEDALVTVRTEEGWVVQSH